MRRILAPSLAVLLLGGVSVPQAAAQERGVYFDDPASPAGKEYAVPLDRARREGRGSDDDQSRRRTQRFGAGVTPPPGGGGGPSNPSSGAGKAGAREDSRGAEARRGAGSAIFDESVEGLTRTVNLGTAAGGLSPGFGLSALAVGVLLAGLLLGLLLRRLRSERGS
jgi:hypothetical protein